jgi:ubiquinone/menaquinone biosynthesis C-methylase UbiE
MIELQPEVNIHEVGETIKAEYREITPIYRRDDEIEVGSENHRRLRRKLRRICNSFAQPITVLDIGCGTGRFFHCLENVEELVGIDICEDMLDEARDPVRSDEIIAKGIQLIAGNIYLHSFPANSFHFIYSLGMFGHGCPVTAELCDKIHRWLVPGGVFFFNLVDFAGLPLWYRGRRTLRDLAYPMLPRSLRARLDQREQRSPFFGKTKSQLEKLMHSTCFAGGFVVRSEVCNSPLWSGRHLECLAHKVG